MNKPVILCADDEKIVLISLKEQLKRSLGSDYSIETAESGQDALELFEELLDDNYEIPLIISDYIMPDIKGDEVLRRIHAISPKTLKIMLTGQANIQGITNAVNQANLYRYIAKPWEQEDFVLTVNSALKSYFQDRQIEEQHKKLKESEEKYRSIFENATEGIFQSSITGCFISANSALARIMGYDSPQELIESITDIKNQLYVNPEIRDELIRRVREQKAVTGFEAEQYRKDKSKIWISLNIRSVYDNDGKFLFMEGFLEDITRRKQNEEALIRAYEKRRELEQIINHSPVVLFLWKNAPGWPVEFVSENVRQFGYTPEDFISGRVAYAEIVHPDDLLRVGQEVEYHSHEEKREFTQEYRILTRSGEVRWTDDHTWIRRNADGNITHYQGIVLDITVSKEKEKAEREREIAQVANKKIMDSINYAKIIQRSLFTSKDVVKAHLPQSFTIWLPRDIVGGDIVFSDFFKDEMVTAVADCTGHGVPGAFMTMITSSGLKRIIRDEGCHDPAEILKQLNFTVKTLLRQDTEQAHSDDGLEAGICFVKPKEKTLIFAGAKLDLYYTREGEICTIRGDKENLGYKRSDLNFNFTNHKVGIEKGMCFYMITDGFIDQYGETEKRRFGRKRFRNLLKEIFDEPFEKQKQIIIRTFEEYRGNKERMDDVTVVGFSPC